MTFSPVADVNNNAANPIINTRSFGSDPHAVARFVAAAVRGTQDAGMLATAKHFPGHGDTDTDSHISLPIIRADWGRLDTLELIPFRAAIAAGVDVVMSAHIAMPASRTGPCCPRRSPRRS
jgi:beta-N-acetylhexosaminidase